jgi:hypothetical protein
LNGETVRWDITYLELEVPLDEADYFQIEIIAPGYRPWVLQGRGKLKGAQTWQGPIWLLPQSSDLTVPTPQTL